MTIVESRMHNPGRRKGTKRKAARKSKRRRNPAEQLSMPWSPPPARAKHLAGIPGVSRIASKLRTKIAKHASAARSRISGQRAAMKVVHQEARAQGWDAAAEQKAIREFIGPLMEGVEGPVQGPITQRQDRSRRGHATRKAKKATRKAAAAKGAATRKQKKKAVAKAAKPKKKAAPARAAAKRKGQGAAMAKKTKKTSGTKKKSGEKRAKLPKVVTISHPRRVRIWRRNPLSNGTMMLLKVVGAGVAAAGAAVAVGEALKYAPPMTKHQAAGALAGAGIVLGGGLSFFSPAIGGAIATPMLVTAGLIEAGQVQTANQVDAPAVKGVVSADEWRRQQQLRGVVPPQIGAVLSTRQARYEHERAVNGLVAQLTS